MNEDFRKSPPEALPAIPFNIPTAEKFTLENGLRVVVVEDRRFPVINLRLGFHFGDINDPAGGTGVNSAMASLLTEGTENYTSRQLAEKIDSLGADLSVGSGYDNTVMRVSCLSSHFDETSALMEEVLLRPVFPAGELGLYKQNAIEGLKYQRSQPDFLSDEQVSKIIYGDHPYSVNSPVEKDFEALGREALVDAHKRGIIPNNAVLVSVGDISAPELKQRLEEILSGWEPGEAPAADLPPLPERHQRSLTIVDRPGSSQANIVLTNLAIERTNPDYFPFLLMNQVLGAGASSRLFMNLREEKGYTYGAYSRIYARRYAGSFEAASEVRTSVTGASLDEFLLELDKIRNERVGETELEDAKNFLAGVFPIRAETQSGLIGLIASQQLSNLPDDYLETYRDRVRAVTAEDVMRVAKLYVHPDKMALVIVGDAAEVLEQTRSFADDIAILDAEGKTLDQASFVRDAEAPNADFAGTWSLEIDAQGQKLPVTLRLTQNGAELGGEIESMLGDGRIHSASVNGSRFTAAAVSDFQGQEIELSIAGVADGQEIKGTITIPIMPEPLSFKGTKS